MMEPRVVCLLGRSMLISLVAELLAQNTNLRVMQFETWEEIDAMLESGIDVLVYDLACASGEHILPLLLNRPGLQLIGLDAESNRAVLLTGEETCWLTLERVKEMVEGGKR